MSEMIEFYREASFGEGYDLAMENNKESIDILRKQLAERDELLQEWFVWYASMCHIGSIEAESIIRGESKWIKDPPSRQSIPGRTLSMLKKYGKSRGSVE